MVKFRGIGEPTKAPRWWVYEGLRGNKRDRGGGWILGGESGGGGRKETRLLDKRGYDLAREDMGRRERERIDILKKVSICVPRGG